MEANTKPWLLILRVLVVGCFLLLLAALFQAQVFKGSYFRSLADGNRVKEVPIPAPRGIVYDRNGVALTVNLPEFRVNGQTISKDQAIGLEAKGEGPLVAVGSARSYPDGKALAHLLGYVSFDGGHSGVEEEYEGRLKGRDGKELVEVDAVGKKLRTISTVPALAGENLTLTIDRQLQKVAYREVEGKNLPAGRQGAAVVVTDPATGAVLALVSSPSFDPEHVADYLNQSDQPLFDRAISGTYPSGSTFKIVTATAGLESGKITESTTVDDPGILVIGPYKFPNWKYLRDGGLQGTLNVVGALQKSNDIFFYKAGEAVGVDDLINFAKKFGLSQRLGIDLPGEAPGSLPTRTDWYLGDTYHLAIGQGDLLVTPLQVNNWTAVIANGGKFCRPHVTGSVACKDLGFSTKTIDLVKQGLVAACSPGGTAWPLFNFKVPVACKTGTAEYGDPANRTHAWLTAFAPAKKPTIAVTVLVEGGGEGSDVAAPIVKKILEEWFR